jgi:hypothetical protein
VPSSCRCRHADGGQPSLLIADQNDLVNPASHWVSLTRDKRTSFSGKQVCPPIRPRYSPCIKLH